MLQTIKSTERWWSLEPKTLFHHAISQFVTQLVSFKRSQLIRKNLYLILGDPYDQNIFNRTPDSELIRIGITHNQIVTLRQVSVIINTTDTVSNNLERLRLIHGIGPWTIKSIILMLRAPGWEKINLYEDAYIRNRLKELTRSSTMTQGDAKKLINIICENTEYHCGICSMFLWRITSNGINNLHAGNQLGESDFIVKYSK